MPPAGAVDGRWPSETTSLSTSTRAAPTRRTRPSTSPTRSRPRCRLDRGSSALVPGAEHGDCSGGDGGCVVVAEAIVATQGHHNRPGGVLTGIEGRADGVAHRQAVRAGAVVDVVVIEDLDVGVLGGVGAGGCRGNRRQADAGGGDRKADHVVPGWAGVRLRTEQCLSRVAEFPRAARRGRIPGLVPLSTEGAWRR